MPATDIRGIPICRGDVVACPIGVATLCFGVVSCVCADDTVIVQTISTTRQQKIVPTHFLFPAIQIVLVNYSTIQPDHVDFDLIGKFHRMYK